MVSDKHRGRLTELVGAAVGLDVGEDVGEEGGYIKKKDMDICEMH